MKAFLMFPDRDFDLRQLVPNDRELTEDLDLGTLFTAMAGGDQFLHGVARTAILTPLTDPAEIDYRQQILADCLARPDDVRHLYDLAVEAIEGEKGIYRGFFSDKYPDAVLHRAIKSLELLTGVLHSLRRFADTQATGFHSEGFMRFFAMIKTELDEEYFATVTDHLARLRFRGGVLITARFGTVLKGSSYTLRRPNPFGGNWVQRLFARGQGYSFQIPERDENGYKALSELQARGINLVANALARSDDHILSFFRVLRTELGFYLGCLNLYDQLTAMGEPVCEPAPSVSPSSGLAFRGLYDTCLALRRNERITGNDLNALPVSLILVTGANEGGKSTFLRSIGLAQLMMQAGMFATAESFSSTLTASLFTHFRREEDATLESGKFEEELKRMAGIADRISHGSTILFNESFAATNEREGSEIARQITRALLDAGNRVIYVTHMYDLASSLHRLNLPGSVFLRADRQADGSRTFKILPGEPLATSYGEDLYDSIFVHPAPPQPADTGTDERQVTSAETS